MTQYIFPQFKVLRMLNKNRKMCNTCSFQAFERYTKLNANKNVV